MTAILDAYVADRPDAPAVVDERGTTTWRELDERATRLVHALRDRGLRPGDRVLGMLGNQVEAVEVALACAHGGWVQVPVNWNWVAREVAYVVDDADAAAVVVDERWAPVVAEAVASQPGDGPLVVAVGDPAAAGPGAEPYEELLASGHPGPIEDAQRGGPMFYTSGTTGNPKGVRGALSQVGGPPEVFVLIASGLEPMVTAAPAGGRVQLVCGPMYHSAQWAFGLLSLYSGSSLVLQQKFDAAGVLDLIDRHGVTDVHLVPTQMVRMLDLPDDVRAAFSGATLRGIVHGAAPCSPSVKRRMIEWVGPIVTEYYGGTEGGFITTISAEDWLARPGSVGTETLLAEVAVFGPDGAPLPVGETGEIWFRSKVGSDFEYHKAPDKTAAAHREGGWGTLGDVGRIDEDGYLYLSDRKIDMVVSGGVNIYPAEVEAVLSTHPAVAEVAVFGVPHEEMGEAVHAAIALAPGVAWTPELEAELDALCRRDLAGYKRPRSYEAREELPHSEAGKLLKRELRDPWWVGRDRSI
ncbi:MAG: AMP-binding protein [Acidimicrobiales bacterium]